MMNVSVRFSLASNAAVRGRAGEATMLAEQSDGEIDLLLALTRPFTGI